MTGSENRNKGSVQQPPPAQGVRLEWAAVPAQVRAAVEQELGGSVVSAVSQPLGFSPGVAARLRLADGRRVFVKALSPEQNTKAVTFHRREARIAARLPAATPAPRLLWSLDDEAASGWIMLVFEDIEGRHPAQPWRSDELNRVLQAMEELAAALTPSPLPRASVVTAAEKLNRVNRGWRQLRNIVALGSDAALRNEDAAQIDRLDPWSARHLAALAAIEEGVAAAVDGDTLLHADVRADNILLSGDRVWFVDWPHACTGAAWVDLVLLAPSVAMQGGPAPQHLLGTLRHRARRRSPGNYHSRRVRGRLSYVSSAATRAAGYAHTARISGRAGHRGAGMGRRTPGVEVVAAYMSHFEFCLQDDMRSPPKLSATGAGGQQ
jgi:aminoglycoside phosphotransferase (APT) family kinase protein